MMERQPTAAPAPADPVPGAAAAIDSAAPAPAKSPARPVEGTAPNVPFEPGLYAQRKDGFGRIEGQAMSFQRSGSRLQSTVTFGIRSAKMNSQMLGKDAGNKVDSAPIFFYRVASGNEASGGSAGDLILAKLKVKGGRRQFELGASGTGRDSAGLSIRSQIECRRTAVAPGLYRIQPASELKPGQYAFYLFRAQLPPLVYDFEVEYRSRMSCDKWQNGPLRASLQSRDRSLRV